MKPEDFDLENELRSALRAVEPDRDFAAVIYSRSHVQQWRSSKGMLALLAAMILLLVMPAGGFLYYRRQEERKRVAAEQLATALRITQDKLKKTGQMVERQLNRQRQLNRINEI